MYELKRVYTNIRECYIEGKGWITYNNVTTGDKVTMYALDYIGIDVDGNIHYTGIEDFSTLRFKKLGFACVELKNKTVKDNPTLKTTYRHTLVKTMYVRYSDKLAIKWYRTFLKGRYRDSLPFNEIVVSYH